MRQGATACTTPTTSTIWYNRTNHRLICFSYHYQKNDRTLTCAHTLSQGVLQCVGTADFYDDGYLRRIAGCTCAVCARGCNLQSFFVNSIAIFHRVAQADARPSFSVNTRKRSMQGGLFCFINTRVSAWRKKNIRVGDQTGRTSPPVCMPTVIKASPNQCCEYKSTHVTVLCTHRDNIRACTPLSVFRQSRVASLKWRWCAH